VKRSSVVIYHHNYESSDLEPCGIGFFVSPHIIITANHNIKDCPDSTTIINVKMFNDSGDFIFSTVSVKSRHPDYDLAVLYIATMHEHFLRISEQSRGEVVVGGENRLAITSFNIAMNAQLADIQFTGDGEGFAVMSAQIIRKSKNHLVYSSNLFSGDSGGAVIFTKSGEVIGLHLETVNQASEELEHGSYTLEDVANSVNSVIQGFSQGFLGLRLDSEMIQNLIFQ
jgi:V8-like Glu-specific endopeptidase